MVRLTLASKVQRYSISSFNLVSGASDKLICRYIDLIRNAILNADSVYVFRSYNHLSGAPECVEFAKNHCCEKLSAIHIDLTKPKRTIKIRSSDQNPIYRLNLNDPRARKTFMGSFKISIRDFWDHVHHSDEILIDDPLYDQYDFLFERNGKIMLWTDIHALDLFEVTL